VGERNQYPRSTTGGFFIIEARWTMVHSGAEANLA
jgi:hypothetical protein